MSVLRMGWSTFFALLKHFTNFHRYNLRKLYCNICDNGENCWFCDAIIIPWSGSQTIKNWKSSYDFSVSAANQWIPWYIFYLHVLLKSHSSKPFQPYLITKRAEWLWVPKCSFSCIAGTSTIILAPLDVFFCMCLLAVKNSKYNVII